MAQLDLHKVKRIDKNRTVIHKKVLSTYTVFQQSNQTYTYGTDKRESPDKISQSLQFDKDTAKFIVDL